jgi:hypothetical protein
MILCAVLDIGASTEAFAADIKFHRKKTGHCCLVDDS